MHKSTLKSYLRAGTDPRDIPGVQQLDEGMDSIGYRVGRWVFKQVGEMGGMRRGWGKGPVKTFAKHNLKVAPRTFVRGPDIDWEIQPYYRPLNDAEAHHVNRKFGGSRPYDTSWEAFLGKYDLGAHNIGVDERGNYVAFDW